jgi:hypothetical protein
MLENKDAYVGKHNIDPLRLQENNSSNNEVIILPEGEQIVRKIMKQFL